MGREGVGGMSQNAATWEDTRVWRGRCLEVRALLAEALDDWIAGEWAGSKSWEDPETPVGSFRLKVERALDRG